ncbi:MAG: hydroxymethylbilane synthase [Clostridia bacterium]|nr:hydroxymethylbilane synthase [Clostridia bacterium]
MKKIVRVGTRESNLAVVQSKWVINEIKRKFPDIEFELVGIKTSGDAILDQRLDKIGGKGLFIKELENALIKGTIDIAVHSMKDMPAEIPDELVIAAVSGREDPRDVLITSCGKTLDELDKNAVLGTSSIRREIQILQKRPDLNIKTLRGNVLTRLDKLLNNEYDAIVLAMAGLKRLGLEEKCVQAFSVEEMIPAVGQGALAIEARKGEDLSYLMDSVHDADTALAVTAERAYMLRLNGGCTTPIAAHAVIEVDRMRLYGMYASGEKSGVIRKYIEGNKQEAAALGGKLAGMMMERGKV